MKELIDGLQERAGDIATILIFSFLGFWIYVLSQTGTMKARIKGGILGFCISMAFAYPTYLFVGAEKWWALAALSSVLTFSGQFLPELITLAAQKFVKKFIKDKGINLDDR